MIFVCIDYGIGQPFSTQKLGWRTFEHSTFSVCFPEAENDGTGAVNPCYNRFWSESPENPAPH